MVLLAGAKHVAQQCQHRGRADHHRRRYHEQQGCAGPQYDQELSLCWRRFLLAKRHRQSRLVQARRIATNPESRSCLGLGRNRAATAREWPQPKAFGHLLARAAQ
jgi:hypothetical protein